MCGAAKCFAQSGRILPFFDHRDDFLPGDRLAIDGVFQINGRPVFDAPLFGTDVWHKCAKRLQKIVSPAGGGANRGNYVNHWLNRLVACLWARIE